MKLPISCLFLTLVFLSGCQANRTPCEFIVEPDISASIDPDAQRQMFEALATTAASLQRGDSLTIIPITADPETELQGKTLRYQIPPSEKREAYDSDLRAITARIKDDLARLAAESTRDPGAHTDILGSVQLACKSFSGELTDKELIIMSDFIEDDPEYKFDSDRRLGTPDNAVALAIELEGKLEPHESVKVVMGRLRSTDFVKLNISRRRGIDTFWHELLGPSAIEPDGIFALRRALSDVPYSR